MPSFPLSDADWERISHLFAADKGARAGKPERNPREVMNAILWVRANQMKWEHLPDTFPPAAACHIKQVQWGHSGVLAQALFLLEFGKPPAGEPVQNEEGSSLN